MITRQNPFHEIYLTENATPEGFIKVFSPALVGDALALFQPGNVVLMGIQGTGKSALLNLLKPEQRIAYLEAGDAGNPFPVPAPFSKFICGGINLTRSGAIDFGQRSIEDEGESEEARVPAYFSDFLNYWIVRDVYRSYTTLVANDLARVELGLAANDNEALLDEFARTVSSKDCWGGYLDGVESIAEFSKRIDYRIRQYRDFLNYNIDQLDPFVKRTKTSAGIPISVFAETMKRCKLIPSDLQVFVRIDQYEELDRLEDWSSGKGLYQSYKGVVNKMLGSRDPHVSYRIGTRRHAWDDAPQVYGTATVIEELRNFRIIDIDELLRRKENRPWMFPAFAEDVFKRRVNSFKYVLNGKGSDYLKTFFGKSPTPDDLANLYVKSNPEGTLRIDPGWPMQFSVYLSALAAESPLEGRLAEAWIRQKFASGAEVFDLGGWSSLSKRYWVKERIDQALMQIAASKKQKLLWAGAADVLNLSGANILVFVSICQYIWDAWLRTSPEAAISSGDEQPLPVPSIEDIYIQDEGIQQASSYWYRKLRADPSGDSRQRFVSALATMLRDRMLNDRKMSNPGQNGFSLSRKELDHHPQVAKFLNEAAAFGALYDRRHTSKTKSRGESTKWYLNPILSPYFQLPVSHTKEPYYADVSEIVVLLQESHAIVGEKTPSEKSNVAKNGRQQDLFGE
ncbi:hypothetical protein ACOCG7_23495 [Paraburkholderia sp. DD10]|uniref:ORC-CDC6 family AAA ATPase n=1 Tax=Paraburkholderia sp. DD10 TaxID=3409691 RepID=UPI003B9F01B6